MTVHRRSDTVIEKASSQSSDKLLQILECIANNRLPIRLQELSKQVNMTQPTVLRYLNALVHTNYVYQEEDTLRYALTWKICGLGQGLNSYSSLRGIAGPFINRLSAEMELGSCLVVDHNFECMYLDCVDVPSALTQTLHRIGRSAPLHTTGSGKILLASYNNVKVEKYIDTKGLTKLTEQTITSADRLFEELAQVRARGYSIDEEECESGLRCVSVPLHSYTGDIIAALSIFGPTSVLTLDRIEVEGRPALFDAARAISSRLGYASPTSKNPK